MTDPRITGDHPATPFALPAGKTSHLNVARVIEALVIAGAAAIGSSLLTTARLEERLSHLARDQEKTSGEIRQLRQDFYRPRFEPQAMHLPPALREADR